MKFRVLNTKQAFNRRVQKCVKSYLTAATTDLIVTIASVKLCRSTVSITDNATQDSLNIQLNILRKSTRSTGRIQMIYTFNWTHSDDLHVQLDAFRRSTRSI